MRMLFIGGTRFVGRAMAEAALAAGHDVTLLHRGSSRPAELAGAEHLIADRDDDLSVLAQREFDATIDVCAYLPRQVDELASALGARGGHHVFISTMSVYAEADAPGLNENAALATLSEPATEVTGETYGPLKALCEQMARAAYGEERLTIIRPTYVVGPQDYTYRFPYWVQRIAAGGEVLAPGPRQSPVQVVDARDQAAWTVRLAESRTPGVFNSIGTSLPFGFEDLLAAVAAAVAPAGTELTWVDGDWLVERGVTGRDLPLWSEGGTEWTLAASNAAALASGLEPRPLADTVRDVLAWIQLNPAEPSGAVGMTTEQEREVLSAWRTR